MVAAVAAPPVATADSGQVPTAGAVIGGPGHAETYPSGLETTADGGVVLADTAQDRIERYNSSGQLLWWRGGHGAGAGQLTTPRDIGIDASGNIYVADTGNTSVVKYSSTGDFLARFRGPANDRIKSPIGLTVVNGTLLVADAAVPAIRVLDLDGVQRSRITSPAGCPFAAIRDVTQDSAGNFYVANYTRNNVLKLRPNGTCLASFGVKGTGNGQWKNPYGVAVARDPSLGEVLYVADSNNNRIQVLELDGSWVASFGTHGGFGVPGTFDELRRVAVAPDGDVWGADLWGFTAKRWDRSGAGWSYAQTIGAREPGSTAGALFNQPNGLDFDAQGNLLVADRMHHRFATFRADGSVRLCGVRGSTSLGFNWPRDMAVDAATGEVWLADTHQNRLQLVTAGCTRSTPYGNAGTALNQMKFPSGIDIRESDRVAFVADTNNNRLVTWDVARKAPVATAGLGLKRPRGVFVDQRSGEVLVADRGSNRVLRISSARGGGSFTVVATYTGFSKPEGVTMDDVGRIYVADTLNDRVVVLNATGTQIGVLTGFDDPVDVEWNDGVLYVSDTYADRVRTYAWP